MVRFSESTGFFATKLGLWTGVDCAVCLDGNFPLPRCPSKSLEEKKAKRLLFLWITADLELLVVGRLFWASLPALRAGHHSDPLGRHIPEHQGVHRDFKERRVLTGSLHLVGVVCTLAELRYFVAELVKNVKLACREAVI